MIFKMIELVLFLNFEHVLAPHIHFKNVKISGVFGRKYKVFVKSVLFKMMTVYFSESNWT